VVDKAQGFMCRMVAIDPCNLHRNASLPSKLELTTRSHGGSDAVTEASARKSHCCCWLNSIPMHEQHPVKYSGMVALHML